MMSIYLEIIDVNENEFIKLFFYLSVKANKDELHEFTTEKAYAVSKIFL